MALVRKKLELGKRDNCGCGCGGGGDITVNVQCPEPKLPPQADTTKLESRISELENQVTELRNQLSNLIDIKNLAGDVTHRAFPPANVGGDFSHEVPFDDN